MSVDRRGFIGGALSLGALTLAGCATSDEVVVEDDGVVHPLAGLTDFDGKKLEPNPILAIAGRPATVVDFWASWCVPCRQSFPHLDQLYRTWMAHGLDMVGVSVDDDPVAARRFWAQQRPRFPIAWDANATVREQFGVVSLPTTVLLDRNGSIVVRTTGFDAGEHRYLE
ncbi:MAG TPA: TlpA disulfide reductase family protein, partial [Myxococcota bacterium]